MTTGSILQLSVGKPRDHGASGVDDLVSGLGPAAGGPWTSGIFKAPVDGPVWLSPVGFEGDGQADLMSHGGLDKAVCAYSGDHYPGWRRELGLEPFPYGAFGENLTLAGLDERTVCIGDLWAVETATMQVSQPRQPCWKLGRRWELPSLPYQVRQSGRTGWYFRVIQEGHVAAGARLSLVARPHPTWTIAAANAVMTDRVGDTAALATLDELSSSWQQALRKRLDLG